MNDEKVRIDDLRTVAKWQLAALGAVATAIFAGVVLNKMPNPADPAGGGWGALWVAGIGAVLSLSSIIVMITLVGWVLAPQYRSLEEQLRRGQKRRVRNGQQPWYDQPTLYLPYTSAGIHTLKAFLGERDEAYAAHLKLASKATYSSDDQKTLSALETYFSDYFKPLSFRLEWRSRREIVAERARIALLGLGILGSLSALGVVLYLGALAYHQPETTAHTLNLPAYGMWRPLIVGKPQLSSQMKTDLGEKCALVSPVQATAAAGVRVMVLQETPADHTYQVLVTASGCTPRLYTVPQDEVAASTPFALPSP